MASEEEYEEEIVGEEEVSYKFNTLQCIYLIIYLPSFIERVTVMLLYIISRCPLNSLFRLFTLTPHRSQSHRCTGEPYE